MKTQKYLMFVTFFLILIFSFYSGFYYRDIKATEEGYILYANLSGAHLQEINRVFDSIKEGGDFKKLQFDFNSQILVDFGCAPWIDYIQAIDGSNFELFFQEIKRSMEIVNGQLKDDKCINNIKDLVQGS